VEACPFCGGEVSEQVVLYGGTCPTCFGHIPGEEAATDPGEDVKQALEAEDRKRAQRKALLPLLIAAPIVLLIAGGALWLALRPEPELAMLDLDEGQFYTPDLDGLIVAQAEEPPKGEADEKEPASTTRKGSDDTRVAAAKTEKQADLAPSIKAPNLSGGDAASDAELLSGLGAAEAEDITRSVKTGEDLTPNGIEKDLDLKTKLSTGGSVGGGGMAMEMGSISQSGPPLSNPQKIAYMVQGVLRRQLPRLRPCYESSLRANPGFRGSWVLTFTIETDGSVSSARANGQDASDDLFEQCLVRRIEGWRFKRIVKPQPVKKTVDFTK